MAGVPCPIIEADFLHEYNLCPDLRGRRLVDSTLARWMRETAGYPVSLQLSRIPVSLKCVLRHLLQRFPQLSTSVPRPTKEKRCSHRSTPTARFWWQQMTFPRQASNRVLGYSSSGTFPLVCVSAMCPPIYSITSQNSAVAFSCPSALTVFHVSAQISPSPK